MKLTTESKLFKRMFKTINGKLYEPLLDSDEFPAYQVKVIEALAAAEECLKMMDESYITALSKFGFSEDFCKNKFQEYAKSNEYIK